MTFGTACRIVGKPFVRSPSARLAAALLRAATTVALPAFAADTLDKIRQTETITNGGGRQSGHFTSVFAAFDHC